MSDEINAMLKKIYKQLGLPNAIDDAVTLAFAETLIQGVEEGFGAIRIEYEAPDVEMLDALRRDVYHFSAAKNYTQLKALTQQLISPEGRLRSFNEFKKAAAAVNDEIVNTWLSTEYNLAVAGGQMSSKWVAIQQDKAVLPLLEFDAVIDGRTTEICSSLHKVVRAVDDPFWQTYYPPNHFNCRSTVRQVNSATVTELANITYPDIPDMFKTNLAKSGLVFPKKHAYYKDNPAFVIQQATELYNKSKS